MNVILALNDEKIYNQLKGEKDIYFKDIQYKEGIIECLEKNKNIDYIIINENLFGQISIIELTNKIKKINNKINIIFFINKINEEKNLYFLKNNIKYLFLEKLNSKIILELINKKNNIIGFLGNSGCGKSINLLIIAEILLKDKKILIIDDNIKNNSISKIYLKQKNKDEIIKIKKNLYLINIKNFLDIKGLKNKEKIINLINKNINNFDYIFIDIENFYNFKIYNKIINKSIIFLNPNILEINKIKNNINKLILANNNCKIILNNYNQNSISEKIIEKLFKIKIIGKIKNNKNINLIINNNFKFNLLNLNEKNNYLKIIKNI